MLRASPEYVQSRDDHSFLLRCFGVEAFEAPYHFHPEYELTYITHGSGKRYVSNHMAYFGPGDLVLIGPNVPHCWKLESTGQPDAGAVVVQFSVETLGEELLGKREMEDIRKLLQRAQVGLCFDESISADFGEALHALSGKSGFHGLIAFLEILQRLAGYDACMVFNPYGTIAMQTPLAQQRMAPVFAYLVEHFKGKVSLEEAAAIAHMTPPAFCKYFKKTTRKTFMETVMEYRVNYATQQLIQTDKPVSEIAFESGFADVSFFHRTFKKKWKVSPLNYRLHFTS